MTDDGIVAANTAGDDEHSRATNGGTDRGNSSGPQGGMARDDDRDREAGPAVDGEMGGCDLMEADNWDPQTKKVFDDHGISVLLSPLRDTLNASLNFTTLNSLTTHITTFEAAKRLIDTFLMTDDGNGHSYDVCPILQKHFRADDRYVEIRKSACAQGLLGVLKIISARCEAAHTTDEEKRKRSLQALNEVGTSHPSKVGRREVSVEIVEVPRSSSRSLVDQHVKSHSTATAQPAAATQFDTYAVSPGLVFPRAGKELTKDEKQVMDSTQTLYKCLDHFHRVYPGALLTLDQVLTIKQVNTMEAALRYGLFRLADPQ
jgi:hypothetical protein